MNISAVEKYQQGQLILVDKELTWTSFDVVNKLRYAFKKSMQIKKLKVGHAGTLDPLASGLLLVCTGKMTKQIDSIQAQEKEYSGVFTIGATTPSFDLETKIENEKAVDHVTEDAIAEVIQKFIGEIKQIPPNYSAVKVEGKRAYEMAREGLDVKISPKIVSIHKFEAKKISSNQIAFNIVCSKGTYIRALARDIGEELNCGAYLSVLRRERIGNYFVKNALTVKELVDKIWEEGKTSSSHEVK